MVSFILPGNSASDAYEVANSLRFNDGSTDSLERDFDSGGSRRTFTVSLWVKRTEFGATNPLWAAAGSGGGQCSLVFDSSDKLQLREFNNTDSEVFNLHTNALFRDPSAWYHIVAAVDTTQSTSSNRAKLYVNGVEQTYSTASYPSQNYDLLMNSTSDTGRFLIANQTYNNPSVTFDGYLTEIVFINNSALDPTSFGEFDSSSEIWKPIDVTGLTFGTNGFYLNVPGPSTGQNANGLGGDSSGNGNHFASSGLSAVDQSLDTCTNNYNILNPFLMSSYESQLSDGNLQTAASDVRGRFHNIGTIGFDSGKYYAEFKMTGGTYQTVGVCTEASFTTASTLIQSGLNYLGQSNSLSYIYYVSDGDVWANGTITSVGDTLATDDILGVYVDLDNHKLYFSKNGTLQSSTGISLPTGYTYFFAVGDLATGSTATVSCNFGSPAYSISSSNTDDNGHGNFEYSPNITGDGSAKSFYALNTKNLAEFG